MIRQVTYRSLPVTRPTNHHYLTGDDRATTVTPPTPSSPSSPAGDQQLRPAGVGHGRHGPRRDTDAVHGVVPGGLEDDRAEERDLGARAATGVGLGVVSDGVGDAALLAGGPWSASAGPSGPGPQGPRHRHERPGRGGRRTKRCRAGSLPVAAHRRRWRRPLGQFLHDNVVEGSTVITDGWQPYRAATRSEHHDRRQTGADPTGARPGRAPSPCSPPIGPGEPTPADQANCTQMETPSINAVVGSATVERGDGRYVELVEDDRRGVAGRSHRPRLSASRGRRARSVPHVRGQVGLAGAHAWRRSARWSACPDRGRPEQLQSHSGHWVFRG